MKKYYLFVMLLLFGCRKIFHEDDNKYIVIDKPQEMIDVLNGIYSRLVRVHDYNYFTVLDRSDDINIYNSYAFSYKTISGGYTGCSATGTVAIDYAGIADNIYVNLYSGIISANSLIKQVSQTDHPEIVGEAYFLRAYSYFKLARLFGTPPLVSDIDVNYLVKQPTYREVYEFIENDLLKAIELLPDTYTDARIPGETPHKGTAKAMLAEVYLAMAGYPVNDKSKYAEAAQMAGDVINNAGYYNYALLDDFADLWKSSNRINSENIFGLFFNGDSLNEGTSNTIGDNAVNYGMQSGNPSIYSYYKPEFKYFNSFPDNYRKYISLITGQYNGNFFYDPYDSSVSGLKFNKYDPLVNACDFINGASWMKWIDRASLNSTGNNYSYGSDVTLYLLRYAQTLLTYAEAKARSGELDASAYEAVNMVRRRANKVDIHSPSPFDLKPGLTPEQFADSVVWERAWELGFEPDGRWFDIIRLNLKDSLPSYRYNIDIPMYIPPDDLTKDWYFYKLPKQDLSLDPNLGNNAGKTN